MTVTGVPARHGPVGCEPVTGDVIGFVLTSDDLPSVHVSGDNAALEHGKGRSPHGSLPSTPRSSSSR